MCSIAGVFSKKGEDVYPVLLDMVLMQAHRGSDGFGIAVGKQLVKSSNKKVLQESFLKGSHGIAHSLLSVTGHGVQPFSSCDKKSFLCHNGQLYNYLELNQKLSRHSFESDSDSETILHFLEEHNFDFKKFMRVARGSFSVALSRGEKLFAFRDPLGIKPLWFGENDSFFAFASEPIALRKWNIEFPLPLLPGHVLEVSKSGFKPKKVFSVSDLKKSIPKKSSFEELFSSFKESVFLRSQNLLKAGVLFSGGVDSSVVAAALNQNLKNVGLFSCGVEESDDLVQAEKVAGELGMDFFPRVVQKDEIPLMSLKVLKTLGFFDEMQLGIALPLYGACEEAKMKGFRVVFSGQGSDELFAGYSYFQKFLLQKGFSGVTDGMWSGLEGLWSRNLFRDDLISMHHSLELRLPFLDTDFLRHSMAVLPQEKITSPTDSLRKHPVRLIAKRLGVPSIAVNRPKKAMQYGSGFAREIARLF